MVEDFLQQASGTAGTFLNIRSLSIPTVAFLDCLYLSYPGFRNGRYSLSTIHLTTNPWYFRIVNDLIK